jgi:cytochrome P450
MFKFSAWDKFVDEWETGRIASTELVKLALEEGEGSGEGILHGFLKEDNDDDNTNSKNSKLKCKVSEEAATEMYLMLTLAAADTTSSLINNVLTNLAKNPTIQEKVRKEMKEELNGQDYHPDLANLEYFEQVLKETQRLTPSLPFTNVKDSVPNDLVINGFNVPAGSTFIFSHMGIANDESLAGPEPQKFDPDRFSDDRVAARKGTRAAFLDHPIACKPFGFGARMCVGSRIAKLEYMSIICRLLQDYEISLDEMTNGNKVTPVRLTKTTTIDYPCQTFHVNQLWSSWDGT